MNSRVKIRSDALHPRVSGADSGQSKRSKINSRMTSPGAIYNLGNGLALAGGTILNLREVWDQSSIGQALYTHLIGSPEAAWLTMALILFLISGEIYHQGYQPGAARSLVAWGDFVSGIAAITLTVALVLLGDTAVALLAGFMLTLGKLGCAVAAMFHAQEAGGLMRGLRFMAIASRIPSILALALAVAPVFAGSIPMDAVLLPLLMIVCFLLWFWADLLLLARS